jgi:hypothetical protein
MKNQILETSQMKGCNREQILRLLEFKKKPDNYYNMSAMENFKDMNEHASEGSPSSNEENFDDNDDSK